MRVCSDCLKNKPLELLPLPTALHNATQPDQMAWYEARFWEWTCQYLGINVFREELKTHILQLEMGHDVDSDDEVEAHFHILDQTHAEILARLDAINAERATQINLSTPLNMSLVRIIVGYDAQ
jgi:hypothetical protein